MKYTTVKVHIDEIRAGDTIRFNGAIKTVSPEYIRRDGFFGTTIFGDSYKNGRDLVEKVIVHRATKKRN